MRENNMLKVIYLGTPEFAVAPLKAIMEHHQVVAVVTQPDRPVGRKQILTPTPVKQVALQHHIPVFTFEKISKEGEDILRTFQADIMVTCAYGQILKKNILDLTPMGVYNIHGSLLPRWRGAAPIQWSLIAGDSTTGITILKSDIGMDDGDILLKKEMSIQPTDTAQTLFEKLSVLGAESILEALEQLEQGKATLTPQDPTKVTYARKLEKVDSLVDFSKSAQEVVGWIKGMNMGPVATMQYGGEILKIFDAKVGNITSQNPVGMIVVANPKKGLYIATKDGSVEILELQTPNSKRMTAKSYLNGRNMKEGSFVNELGSQV